MDVRILVIEDDSVNMEMMLYLLKHFGYQTSMAFDGVTGLEMANTIMPGAGRCKSGIRISETRPVPA